MLGYEKANQKCEELATIAVNLYLIQTASIRDDLVEADAADAMLAAGAAAIVGVILFAGSYDGSQQYQGPSYEEQITNYLIRRRK